MRLNKPYTGIQYANLAIYCNENGIVIEDFGDYLEAVNPPEPSIESLQSVKRAERDAKMSVTLDRIDRYRNQIEAGIDTFDNAETYKALLIYMQYLRDFTVAENWWNETILTFDEWNKAK
uniref:Tail fiber assembly protein n=1 Tax=Myoviridae sp. ctwVB15 TaxID=2825208 RepID=A0A8S5UNC6_9CAUD|nr:MAG TPA: tail fiber assembly protein [Myoviridae sp. ctwVB15]